MGTWGVENQVLAGLDSVQWQQGWMVLGVKGEPRSPATVGPEGSAAGELSRQRCAVPAQRVCPALVPGPSQVPEVDAPWSVLIPSLFPI